VDDKIAYAKSKGFSVLLLTNGSLLSKQRFLELQKAGVDSVRVSVYGNTANAYCRVHGIKNSHVFETVTTNLTAILEMKRTTQVLLTYNVLQGYNDKDVNPWITHWRDKADLLEVWRPHNWVDGRRYRKVQHEQLKTCGRPFKTPLQVQVDGTVNMCCFDYNGKLLLGDLKQQSLQEIFSGEAYKTIVRCHTTGDFVGSGLICEQCDQRNKDKSDVMVYNSKYDIKQRVHQVSTTYVKID